MKKKILFIGILTTFTLVNLWWQIGQSPGLNKNVLFDLNIAGSGGYGEDCYDQTWDYIIVDEQGCVVTFDNLGSCWEDEFAFGTCFAGTNHIVQDCCTQTTLVNDFIGTWYYCPDPEN